MCAPWRKTKFALYLLKTYPGLTDWEYKAKACEYEVNLPFTSLSLARYELQREDSLGRELHKLCDKYGRETVQGVAKGL